MSQYYALVCNGRWRIVACEPTPAAARKAARRGGDVVVVTSREAFLRYDVGDYEVQRYFDSLYLSR